MSQTETKKKPKRFTASQKQKNKLGKIINYNYDEEADVLYASVGEPRPAKSVDSENGVILRIDPHSKKYVGFTIINYMDRKKQGKLKRIPHFKGIELPNY
jgi:uncharacterized protein YuzE